MKCKKCEHEFEGKFCPKCGTQVVEMAEEKLESKKISENNIEGTKQEQSGEKKCELYKFRKVQFWGTCICAILVGIDFLINGYYVAGILLLISAIFFCPIVIEKYFRHAFLSVLLAIILAAIGAVFK